MPLSRKPKEVTQSSAVSSIAAAVNKKFGADSMSLLSQSSSFATVKKFISLGHWGLNYICSGKGSDGGLPCGRLTELYGRWSTGKSLLIAIALGNCQKQGGIAGLDDLEHAYLKGFGDVVGVDNNELLYTESPTIEECMDKTEFTLAEMVKVNPFGMYALDSIALVKSSNEDGVSTEDVREGGFDQTNAKAKSLHIGSRKLVSIIGKSDIALVIANQTRKLQGVVYGDPESTTGGDAVPFWASLRLRLSQKEVIFYGEKNKSEIIGVRMNAIAKKNKVARPFKSIDFDIYFDEGIKYASGAADLLTRERKIVDTGAGWFDIKGHKMQGRNKVDEFLEANPDLLDELIAS